MLTRRWFSWPSWVDCCPQNSFSPSLNLRQATWPSWCSEPKSTWMRKTPWQQGKIGEVYIESCRREKETNDRKSTKMNPERGAQPTKRLDRGRWALQINECEPILPSIHPSNRSLCMCGMTHPWNGPRSSRLLQKRSPKGNIVGSIGTTDTRQSIVSTWRNKLKRSSSKAD